MNVVVRVPALGSRPLAPLLDAVIAAPRGEPFADDILDLCHAFASRLMNDPVARVHPELMALGFFMRKTETIRMKREFETAARPDVLRVPQGLVFHVPPGNVDTIFMYSWLLSVLAGNANVVRLSSRGSLVVDHLCRLLDELLARPGLEAVRDRIAMIEYGHDDAITAAVSARAALRIVWGGDATIAAIRRVALAPSARDLTFADRWSLVALGARAIAGLDDAELHALAAQLANDVYWFDQLGCASPRLAIWIGDADSAAAARDRLWPAVAAVAEARGYRPEVATRLGRELFIHRAVLDGPVVGRSDYGPTLAIVRIDRLEGLRREHPGGGLLFEAVAPSLVSLERWIDRKDQTLTHAGIPRHELVGLAERLGGRGLDRIVPVGQALSMARFWDGLDLTNQLVRHVHLIG